MSWIIYALGAIAAGGLADFLRKFGAIKDPFIDNLFFQAGGFVTAIILYLLFSRKVLPQPTTMIYILLGGICVSLFTTFFFKALAVGPGVSTVVPFVRAGAIALVAVLGVIILHEKLTWNLVAGLVFAGVGIYLMFLNS